jgi:hypothetical protein
MLVAEIEKADRSVLRIDEQHAEQVWKEQVDLQRAFRQWIDESITL